MMTVDELVAMAKRDGASDIHLICGLPPKYRKDGQVVDMCDEVLTPDDCEDIAHFLCGDKYHEMAEIGEVDAADTFADNRCRIHVFRQQGVPSVALRLLRDEIPVLANLGLPPAALELTKHHKGISRAHDELLIDELDLVDGGNAGKGGLVVCADHNVVSQGNTEDDHVLQYDHPV